MAEGSIPPSGDWLLPGLIDLHVHGIGTAESTGERPTALAEMALALLQAGTTAFLATSSSDPDARLEDSLSRSLSFRNDQMCGKREEAELLGWHLEGPFLSPQYRGAQPQENLLPPSPDLLVRYQRWAEGTIRILTLAPELLGAEELVKTALRLGIQPSAGHSAAEEESANQAFRWGVRRLTHAFNAMPPLNSRHPGLIGAALLDPRVSLEMIADGIHVHPLVLDLTYRLKGAQRLMLVSDGRGTSPGGRIDLWEDAARLPDGSLAGGSHPLLDGVRTMVERVGVPLHQAVAMASLVPARMLALHDRIGSLAIGREATFLRLGADWRLLEVWQRGRRAL